MSSEGFWTRVGKTALNVVTLGAMGKVETVREEADETDQRYRATLDRIQKLEERMRSLANSRGEANRDAHSSLGEVIPVLEALSNSPGLNIRGSVDEAYPAVVTMKKIVIDFNVALELATGSGAGVATSAGAWAVVSALGVASTGTAIGGLSGAAAGNAALAWFGGGSLATGGGGMVAGAVVVGGLVLLPLIGVGAWLAHKAADKRVAEMKVEIKKFVAETARLTQAADVIEGECHRVEKVVVHTQELARKLKNTLEVLRSSVLCLEETGIAVAIAMGEPGFNFSALAEAHD